MPEKIENAALFRISYGLYVVTCKDSAGKDNGLVVNTVVQLTSSPLQVAVTINKQSYSHGLIKESGVMNVSCLDESAPFSLFQRFGFQSGKEVDKFENLTPLRAENGLAVLGEHANAFLSLEVTQYVDLGTHGMFICRVTEARVLGEGNSVTYDYYQKKIKPRPAAKKVKGYVCRVCGWVYEGEELPPDLICPICHHGAEDFEPITE